jgi:hypothetical protein
MDELEVQILQDGSIAISGLHQVAPESVTFQSTAMVALVPSQLNVVLLAACFFRPSFSSVGKSVDLEHLSRPRPSQTCVDIVNHVKMKSETETSN